MPRVKRGTLRTKKRRKILRAAKGFLHKRKSRIREARQALFKAGQYAYRDRRKKKAVFRALWHTQMNAALRLAGTTYSVFAHQLRAKNVTLNRKMLAELAREHPKEFLSVVSSVLGSKAERPGS